MVAVPSGEPDLYREQHELIKGIGGSDMENRRTFLGLAAASLVPVVLDAQTQAPPAAGELARHALTGPLEGFEAVLVQLNIPPGRSSSGPGHRHPGPVLGYVVEGQMRFAINHEPEQVLPVGGTFFEPSGAVHTTTGSARPDGPTRVLVFMVVPKGSPLTAPA
jgi:quercetin dioxygenase-like cupin family protein